MKMNKSVQTGDFDIRVILKNALVDSLMESKRQTGHPVRILSELGINNGDYRIDLATVNGILHGYEIKSDKDTLARLPDQCREYSKVFDKLTLVVGMNHVMDALELVPSWWGIVLAKVSENGQVVLSNLRDADNNPSQERAAIARLLWKEEAVRILEQNGYNLTCDVRRESVYRNLASIFSCEELMGFVKARLLYRENWRVDQPLM